MQHFWIGPVLKALWKILFFSVQKDWAKRDQSFWLKSNHCFVIVKKCKCLSKTGIFDREVVIGITFIDVYCSFGSFTFKSFKTRLFSSLFLLMHIWGSLLSQHDHPYKKECPQNNQIKTLMVSLVTVVEFLGEFGEIQ